MGDHLALLVDRLLTESTLEATIKSRKQVLDLPNDSESTVVPIVELSQKRKGGRLVECRICQEEDEVSNMEIPCSCCGSMKVQSKFGHEFCKSMLIVLLVYVWMFDVIEVMQTFVVITVAYPNVGSYYVRLKLSHDFWNLHL